MTRYSALAVHIKSRVVLFKFKGAEHREISQNSDAISSPIITVFRHVPSIDNISYHSPNTILRHKPTLPWRDGVSIPDSGRSSRRTILHLAPPPAPSRAPHRPQLHLIPAKAGSCHRDFFSAFEAGQVRSKATVFTEPYHAGPSSSRLRQRSPAPGPPSWRRTCTARSSAWGYYSLASGRRAVSRDSSVRSLLDALGGAHISESFPFFRLSPSPYFRRNSWPASRLM
ncbi:hypothetical protein VUR80DRAFT_2912 [Thermomyces stellatus]